MLARNDGLRVMWDRTPFPVTITGTFAPHSASNVYIVAKRLRTQPTGKHTSEHELRAVHIGSGAALDGLIACAGRDDIVQHIDQEYELIAFSCFVGEALRESTERFLADALSPLLSETAPNARVNRINLPAVQWDRPGKDAPLRKAG
jgi:hypothetical protein